MAVALASTVSSEIEGGRDGILTCPGLKRLPKEEERKNMNISQELKIQEKKSRTEQIGARVRVRLRS